MCLSIAGKTAPSSGRTMVPVTLPDVTAADLRLARAGWLVYMFISFLRRPLGTLSASLGAMLQAERQGYECRLRRPGRGCGTGVCLAALLGLLVFVLFVLALTAGLNYEQPRLGVVPARPGTTPSHSETPCPWGWSNSACLQPASALPATSGSAGGSACTVRDAY